MLYLEARCLLVTRGSGSQGVQNGSISCVALPESLPGGVRVILAENLLAAMLNLEVASGNDALASHSDMRKTAKLMASGVHLVAPERVVIHSRVRVGADTTIHPGVELSGATRVGTGCVIDTGAVLRDCQVGNDARIEPYSVLEGVRIAPGAVVGAHTHATAGARFTRSSKQNPVSPTRRDADRPRRGRRRPAKGKRKDL